MQKRHCKTLFVRHRSHKLHKYHAPIWWDYPTLWTEKNSARNYGTTQLLKKVYGRPSVAVKQLRFGRMMFWFARQWFKISFVRDIRICTTPIRGSRHNKSVVMQQNWAVGNLLQKRSFWGGKCAAIFACYTLLNCQSSNVHLSEGTNAK